MGAKPSAAALTAFAANNRVKPGLACGVCHIPERDVIDEAKRAAGPGELGGRTVRRWLIAECGYTADTAPSRSQIDHHFHSDHHNLAR